MSRRFQMIINEIRNKKAEPIDPAFYGKKNLAV
jgi:hypothetical protein